MNVIKQSLCTKYLEIETEIKINYDLWKSTYHIIILT